MCCDIYILELPSQSGHILQVAPLKMTFEPLITVVWAAITGTQMCQMWHNGSLHWKDEINTDSEISLIGRLVFPKGWTCDVKSSRWHMETNYSACTAWNLVCCTSNCASLIHEQRSLAINIALPAEQQRTSVPQIDSGRQRPVIKSPSTVMRQKY